MDNRLTRYLTDLLPRTGRVIREDGTTFNEADWGAIQERYNLMRQTVQNGAVEFGKRTTIDSVDSEDPLYYHLSIPPGRRFYLWQRILRLTEGTYNVDLVTVDSVSGGVPAFKSTLSQGATPSVQTELLTNVDITGNPVVIMELARVDTGNAVGTARVGGAADSDNVLKSFTNGSTPVLIRVQKLESGEFTSSISLVAWEEDEA